MPLDGLQEGRATTLQSLEQVDAAKPNEPLASPRQVVDLSSPLAAVVGGVVRLVEYVVAEAVAAAGSGRRITMSTILGAVQLGVLVVGIWTRRW